MEGRGDDGVARRWQLRGGVVVFGQPFGVVFEPTKDLADLEEVVEYI